MRAMAEEATGNDSSLRVKMGRGVMVCRLPRYEVSLSRVSLRRGVQTSGALRQRQGSKGPDRRVAARGFADNPGALKAYRCTS